MPGGIEQSRYNNNKLSPQKEDLCAVGWFMMFNPLSTIFQLYRGCHFIGGGNKSTR
jgi:hypothetical protein